MTNKSTSILAVLLGFWVLCLATPGFAQDVIRGRVVDAADGSGIGDTEVYLSGRLGPLLA